MLFVFFAKDYPNSISKRMAARPSHLARLQLLEQQNRLVMAGPLLNAESLQEEVEGSLIIAEFNSLAEAKQWIAEDPFVKEGIYSEVNVKPFKLVLPHDKN